MYQFVYQLITLWSTTELNAFGWCLLIGLPLVASFTVPSIIEIVKSRGE